MKLNDADEQLIHKINKPSSYHKAVIFSKIKENLWQWQNSRRVRFKEMLLIKYISYLFFINVLKAVIRSI